MVWCDPLNEGPVPGGISEDELVRVRAGFLAPLTPHDVDDVAADLHGWHIAVDDSNAYDELVLWFEHDLFDQLNLIQLLTHLAGRGSMAKPVTLVCIDRYPGHDNFKVIRRPSCRTVFRAVIVVDEQDQVFFQSLLPTQSVVRRRCTGARPNVS